MFSALRRPREANLPKPLLFCSLAGFTALKISSAIWLKKKKILTVILSFNIHLWTQVTSGNVRSIPPTPRHMQARQSSINDVDLPLWWQNKFQLRPCEIGFPRSIRGLRIVERFSRFCSGPPFLFSSRRRHASATRPAACCCWAATRGLCWQSYEINKSLWTDVFFFPGNSWHRSNTDDCRWQPFGVIFFHLVTSREGADLFVIILCPLRHSDW